MFRTATTSWTRSALPATRASISARSATWAVPKISGAKLAQRGLGLAGAYLELPYADPESLETTLPELDAMLDIFDSIKPLEPRP